MSTSAPDRAALETAFTRLAEAVHTGDLALYRSLARHPNDAFQTQLFERNSAILKKEGMRLAMAQAELQGDTATVHFSVRTPTGQAVEEGEMTFVCSEGAWLVQEL